MNDIENQRLADLENLKNTLGTDDVAEIAARYAPGTFGCHEAFHTASVALDLVSGHVLEHPAVILNPDWYALADKARQALFDLYTAIGQTHMDEDA